MPLKLPGVLCLNSIRAQLLIWLLVPLTLFIAFNIWGTYRNATDMATVVQDRMLLGSARIIAERIRYEDGEFQVVIPPAALELFRSASRDRVYYRITGPDGALLSGYADLPTPQRVINAEDTLSFDVSMRGEPVRVAAFSQPTLSALWPIGASLTVLVPSTTWSGGTWESWRPTMSQG